MSVKIEAAVPADQKWVGKLFDANKAILGNVSGGTVFWRWRAGLNPREHVVVIRPELAFAHYLVRKDGTRVLYEMAVTAEAKRQGLGRAILEHIGRPIELKTDADNQESNAFYRRMGLVCVGQKTGGSGKVMNVFQGF